MVLVLMETIEKLKTEKANQNEECDIKNSLTFKSTMKTLRKQAAVKYYSD